MGASYTTAGPLLAAYDKGERHPVYLVHGTDGMAIDELVAGLGARLEELAGSDLNVDTLAAPDVEPEYIFSACATLPMFGDIRLVLVTKADELIQPSKDTSKASAPKPTKRRGKRESKEQSGKELLEAYLDKPFPKTVLVLVAGKLRKNLRIIKQVASIGAVAELAAPDKRSLPQWIIDRGKKEGLVLGWESATALIEHVGQEPRELAQALEKLLLWSGHGSTVSVEMVESVVAQTRLHTVFELVDAITRRDLTQSLVLLRSLMDQREPAIRLLALVVRQFRLIWQHKALSEEGVSPGEICQRLRIPQFVARKLQGPAKRLSHDKLMDIYDHLFAADLRMKSTGREEEAILVELITRLCLR